MEYKLQSLNSSFLQQAIDLVVDVFPEEKDPYDDPRIWLPASLNPKKYQKEYEATECTFIRYWIAVQNDKVLGVIGLYTEVKDQDDCFWITWFCVDKKHRMRGVGKALLSFCFDYAKKHNKKFLRVYTDPSNITEQEAQKLYESFGLKASNCVIAYRSDVIVRECCL